MPLIDVPETRTLSQKFNFLNLGSSEQSDIGRTDVAQSVQPASRPNSVTTTMGKYPATEASELEYLAPDSMRPVGVVKTTAALQKLFINVAYPNQSIPMTRSPGSKFLFSLVKEDRDKSGAGCFVMTVLDTESTVSLAIDMDVRSVLDYVRACTGMTITDKYTLPRMKKKGSLDKIMLPSSQVDESLHWVGKKPRMEPSRLISELDSTDTLISSEPTQIESVNRHSTKLTQAILATPLPSRYTHHFSVLLSQGQTGKASVSWSVYYDCQDSTLKVLLPPKEDFLTIKVGEDDFRAFTKDGSLNIFYIASSTG